MQTRRTLHTELCAINIHDASITRLTTTLYIETYFCAFHDVAFGASYWFALTVLSRSLSTDGASSRRQNARNHGGSSSKEFVDVVHALRR